MKNSLNHFCPGEQTHKNRKERAFLIKPWPVKCSALETTTQKIVPSFSRGTKYVYCYRGRGPAVIPGLHNNIPKGEEWTRSRWNSTSELYISFTWLELCVKFAKLQLCSKSERNAVTEVILLFLSTIMRIRIYCVLQQSAQYDNNH